MSNLIPCIDCGKNVSRSARTCPHCASQDPVGVTCVECEGRLSTGKAATFGDSEYPKYFHPECLTTIVREYFSPYEPLHCHDCHGLLNTPPPGDHAWAKGYPEKPCPHCGCSKPFPMRKWTKSQCNFCFKAIYKFQPIRGVRETGIDYTNYYHIPCYKIKRGHVSLGDHVIEFICKILNF